MHIDSETIYQVFLHAGFEKPRHFTLLSEKENHKIFQLEGAEGHFVLTFHFHEICEKSIDQICKMNTHLFLQGLPLAKLWYFHKYPKFSASIHSYLSGKTPKAWNYQTLQIAAQLIGSIHEYSPLVSNYEIPCQIPNKLENDWKKLSPFIPKSFQLLEKELENILCAWPHHLPKGYIHSDLTLQHILCKNEEITGVIHLDALCYDVLAYDLATLLSHCLFSQEEYPPYELFDFFLTQYQIFRNVGEEELEALFILLKGKLFDLTLSSIQKSLQKPAFNEFYLTQASQHAAKLFSLSEELLLISK